MSGYDRELGTITEQDTSYASDILSDLDEIFHDPRVERVRMVAEWLRKVRYEAVMADRKRLPATRDMEASNG